MTYPTHSFENPHAVWWCYRCPSGDATGDLTEFENIKAAATAHTEETGHATSSHAGTVTANVSTWDGQPVEPVPGGGWRIGRPAPDRADG